jgi:predicted DNA-binding transcriptional regulator AlpA
LSIPDNLAEVRALPPTTDITTAARILGISPSYGYELANRGEFPAKVIMVGTRYRVVTASLLALLEWEA